MWDIVDALIYHYRTGRQWSLLSAGFPRPGR
jgi:hypothetical protein